jgi:hypothetical protein
MIESRKNKYYTLLFSIALHSSLFALFSDVESTIVGFLLSAIRGFGYDGDRCMKMKTYSNRPHLDGQDNIGHISVLEFLILNIVSCDINNNSCF